MKYKSMFPWMLLDMGLFTLINIVLISALHPHFELITFITPIRLAIFALAVYRGANVVSNEFITTPIRAPFVREVNGEEQPYEYGFRGFLGSLLYCPSCTGVWIAMILTYAYLFFPAQTSIVVFILALSGLERFFAYTFGRIKNY